jgi:RHS repeat-associated protein
LGSISTVTNSAGAVVSSQQFDSWGKVRTSGISVTKLNYTGQRKDDTGLLYYHARYYDPSLARFVSPDSIVQGATPLMVQFGDLNASYEKSGTVGPVDPSVLNRYSYTLNNRLKYDDPSGHEARGSRLSGPNQDRGDYKTMLHVTYQTLQKAL